MNEVRKLLVVKAAQKMMAKHDECKALIKDVFKGLVSSNGVAKTAFFDSDNDVVMTLNNSWTPLGSCFGDDFIVIINKDKIVLMPLKPIFGCTDFAQSQVEAFKIKLAEKGCEMVKVITLLLWYISMKSVV